MRIVDLAFKASAGPVARLVFRVEVDATVRMRRGHDIDFEMKILERFFITDVIEMAAISMSYQSATFDFPGVRMFLSLFPAGESFAIEQLNKAFFRIGGKERL